MSPGPTASDREAPEDLAELVASAEVVVFRSGLTDTRTLESWLAGAGIDHRVITLGMGSGAARERYRRLRDWTGWDLLPAVFVHGRFVGGAEEAYALLHDTP